MDKTASPNGREVGLTRGNPQAPRPDDPRLRTAAVPPVTELVDPEAVPSWLRPFTATPTTRFTRTPEYLMKSKGAQAEEPAEPTLARSRPEPQAPMPAAPATPTPAPAASTPARTAPPAPVQGTPPGMANRQPVAPAPVAPVQRAPVPPQAARPAPVPPAPVPAAPVAEEERPVAPPLHIRKLARMIQTDVREPAKPETQDDRPIREIRAERRAESMATAQPVETAPVQPTILPIQAPLRASISVSFSWPVEEPLAPPPPVQAIEPAAPVVARPRLVVVEPEEIVEDEAPVVDHRPEGAALDALRYYDGDDYEHPSLELLAEPPEMEPDSELSEEALNKNSVTLQQTLRDFGVRGEIIDANPGPVVTLYELEPAPGTKSSRVIALSGDIARSMSAVSARVAVVEGRNVIGIELPNARRDTVWLRELLASHDFAEAKAKLGLCLGKTIGGVPVIADLAKMPHLLVAGTTGSGKSVAINTMILSLLYRHRPEECRLIMIDPKMLELSVYDGIPHLLTPVVTDPRKAVVALKWAVREMEERYRKMSRLGVRNIDGFNARVAEASAKGEIITRQIQTGFDRESGDTIFEDEIMDLTPLPFIVVIVDEMADLMMVAGKDIEGAIQRLAQMARAAGIHLIMATQRPSVDVITGTIKANFPTRISFQVTSKIDSRTILGEMGAEQLLGQGDMLYMAGGGRIQRVHGPFVSDHEVEKVVAHLKLQARPEYLDAVTSDEDEEAGAGPAPAAAGSEDGAVFDKGAFGDDGADMYDQAVAIVFRDRKASTSYIQRRLQIGYNRAASIMERMENERIVGPANHAGKREILVDGR
ncbi:DNA translocase FtsK [Kaistia dalseonensis]|uniref:S-DNA-T family DNA segregation ATPase FtsK/SpoIIIE n=1 Tax=Kaistia dalseonensis TaxID=410840 RepID=A0ABU0H792_9HYPH|nr:DNA translocase FtsK [Kaistia dalseonensis]MCX5495580.1 DNA translocase FtsK [Kaistia dalseonensis]MDQ0438172.1 S-DNA-T family DNA segregation ATPase FtsK/SpoIIIE [Kaistia dalseonensis]